MISALVVLGVVLLVGPLLTFLAGGALAAMVFKGRATSPAPAPPVSPRDLAPQVIELAHKSGGRLTSQQLMEELALNSKQASRCLTGLVHRRLCRIENHLGATSYLFERPQHQSGTSRTETQLLHPGSVVGERYEIIRCINQGGMGAIYEARDHKLADSWCAVKEILQSALHGRDGEYYQGRFREEMEALVNLAHPCIPKVRDYLESSEQDGSVYIVMDLVRGVSLEQELELQSGPLDPQRTVRDILRLLEVVHYLHSQSPPVIHRDIKPANIMREASSGELKLVDFGLARRADVGANQTSVGTVGYCAPEQVSGHADARSDLFSVGCTMSHLLSGRKPEWIWLQPLRQDLPASCLGLEDIIQHATQPFPDDRYNSPDEMKEDLERWLQGQRSGAHLTQPLEHLAGGPG